LPPFSIEEAKETFFNETGLSADETFDQFSEAIAAASIAQVHKVRVRETQEELAVKVLRPGIEKAFRKDVDAFYLLAGLVDFFAPFARRLRPVEVIEHFEGIVLSELDLRLESSSASKFKDTTKADSGFNVPSVNWKLSGKRVMTMSWVEGIALGDIKSLENFGHDKLALGERVLQLFLNHALRDGYFHADMHQGNLKVSSKGEIIAYDFGIMGYIDEYTRRVYAEILYGFIKRDYKRVAEVHFEAGYVPIDQDVEDFANALRAVGEPIFGMDAANISMGKLLTYLFEVTERFGMETRTELILLQRTMVVVEGVARSLNPNINIWKTAQPIVENYIRQSIGPKAIFKDIADTVRVIAKFGPRLPDLVENILLDHSEKQEKKVTRSGKLSYFFIAIVSAFLGALATNLLSNL
jgi:ubiquinone biosynthesis protein